ncbi:MAG: TraX protein [Oscillospiraceae bacterium]|nr:TraX protein [Oscillospiraceae bacterium]
MLKLIAVVSMLIDHSALLLGAEIPLLTFPLLGDKITVYYIMRKIGRLAFPIFCFLISEGLVHTRDRSRYILRLFCFAVISELPFNILVSGNLFYAGKQNVFFTLLLGSLLICISERERSEGENAILMAFILAVAVLIKPDYGLSGVILILLIYCFRTRPALQAVTAYPLLSGGFAALAAFIPINLYNHRRGFIKSPALKYAFYIFYPLHILLLAAVKFGLRAL